MHFVDEVQAYSEVLLLLHIYFGHMHVDDVSGDYEKEMNFHGPPLPEERDFHNPHEGGARIGNLLTQARTLAADDYKVAIAPAAQEEREGCCLLWLGDARRCNNNYFPRHPAVAVRGRCM